MRDTQVEPAQEDTRKERPSSIPLSSNPFEPDTAPIAAVATVATVEPSTSACKSVRFDEPKERRNVSAQTTSTQESSQTEDTVCRDPARHTAMPIQEPLDEWGWPGLMIYGTDSSSSNGNNHIHEASDPFSDGKATDRQAKAIAPRHSAGTSREESRTSEGTLEPIAETDMDTIEQVLEPAQPEGANAQISSSANSQTSWTTLDGPKAISAFNQMASQFGIPIAIPVDNSSCTCVFACAWIDTD